MNESFPKGTAAAAGFAGCAVCQKVLPGGTPRCPRCGTAVHLRKPASLQRTVALTASALLLYIPANVLPVMKVHTLEGEHVNTILGGVVTFWKSHSYLVATIIFLASVVIPIMKVIFITWLCWQTRVRHPSPQRAARIYRITELVGRWSMVDVFVVAILVSVVQMGNLMSIEPGGAAAAFAGVVVLTMLAADAFDPRLIWDAAERSPKCD